jgi:hypothetical protein
MNSLSVFNYARNKFLNKRELQKKYLFFKELLRELCLIKKEGIKFLSSSFIIFVGMF